MVNQRQKNMQLNEKHWFILLVIMGIALLLALIALTIIIYYSVKMPSNTYNIPSSSVNYVLEYETINYSKPNFTESDINKIITPEPEPKILFYFGILCFTWISREKIYWPILYYIFSKASDIFTSDVFIFQ